MEYNSYTKVLDYEFTLDTHPSSVSLFVHLGMIPLNMMFFYPHTLTLLAYHQNH